MKTLIKKILFPNKIIGFLIFNIGFGLLIYVFSNHLEETFVAYISYLMSFYALIIFSIWFYKVGKFSNEFIKRSKIYSLYQNNHLIIIKSSISFSFVLNLIYGLLKLGIGIYYKSWWFITFAIYYLLLSLMRFSLLKNINKSSEGYQKLRHTGIILLLLNLILIGIIVLIIKNNQVINYNGFLIYLVALYDFYLIINAVKKAIKYRNNYNPIIVSSKFINLTVAMVAIVSLEVSMIYQFGNNDINFKLIMISLTGFGVCLINSLMAIYMIIKAKKNIKKNGDN